MPAGGAAGQFDISQLSRLCLLCAVWTNCTSSTAPPTAAIWTGPHHRGPSFAFRYSADRGWRNSLGNFNCQFANSLLLLRPNMFAHLCSVQNDVGSHFWLLGYPSAPKYSSLLIRTLHHTFGCNGWRRFIKSPTVNVKWLTFKLLSLIRTQGVPGGMCQTLGGCSLC